MEVLLAGYNIDREVIDELKKSSPPRNDVTPETLSAAYARISRDPRPAFELRRAARHEVERARRSNQSIIFKMGHHSVAEHAVFNFDIIGISRLAIEELEKFRLCSYTEKSQRYIALKDDFVLPQEVQKSGKTKVFVQTVKAQNALYHCLYAKLKPYFLEKYQDLARNPKNHSVLDGWAKEDARYAVSLATEGQLGMTLNARNLELLIRRFASKNLAELKELNSRLYALAKKVAPSIILFTEASDFDARTYEGIARASRELARGKETIRPGKRRLQGSSEFVTLVDCTSDADNKLLASLLHTASSRDYQTCLTRIKQLPAARRRKLIQEAFVRMEFYDFPLREFEYVGFTFDIVLSASCFAQLKRHRMATLTCQRYDPRLGATVPPSIEAIGEKNAFQENVARTNDVYSDLKKDIGQAADYILTNAHRRRVLLRINARELYHISRLREDQTAQWDIRRLAQCLSDQAKKVMPLTCLLLGGKDAYPDVYKKVFGRHPKLFPPLFIQP
jgi:flavin-dependent thymidylate synthase